MEKRKFSHLQQVKRDRLEALWQAGHQQTEIAAILQVHPSTISREIRRHRRRGGRYDATLAQHKAGVKRSVSKHQGMKIEKHPALRQQIIAQLEQQRSPDEIAGRLRREKRRPRVGKDAIYKWLYSVWGQRYCHLLCTRRARRRRQRKNQTKRVMIRNLVGIEALPAGALNRRRYRHWEGDTFVSPKTAQTTASAALVAEKKSKLLAGCRLASLSPTLMHQAVTDFGRELQMKSLVLDRGLENRSHERFGVPSYFCDAHAPWQKPLVESSIGLLRRWFLPKGSNLAEVTEERLQSYLYILNGKYRKSLKYQSALEVAEQNGILKSN